MSPTQDSPNCCDQQEKSGQAHPQHRYRSILWEASLRYLLGQTHVNARNIFFIFIPHIVRDIVKAYTCRIGYFFHIVRNKIKHIGSIKPARSPYLVAAADNGVIIPRFLLSLFLSRISSVLLSSLLRADQNLKPNISLEPKILRSMSTSLPGVSLSSRYIAFLIIFFAAELPGVL